MDGSPDWGLENGEMLQLCLLCLFILPIQQASMAFRTTIKLFFSFQSFRRALESYLAFVRLVIAMT